MRFKEYHFILLLLIGLGVLFTIWSLRSTGSFAGADDLYHTQIAKYSWKYPHLLLDHWGKPFYTLIASPFAQFGNTGTKMMNVLFALLSALVAYATAKQLNYTFSWSVIPILLFAPIYTVLALTGNIEMLGGLIIITSVYFFAKDKPIMGNIIISFGFFVRNEIFVFIPFYIIYCIIRKKYKSIPFIFTAFILYSIVGYFYYHDLFWVITEIPYGSTKELVGTGKLLHYVNNSKVIFGIPITGLLVTGLLTVTFFFFRNGFNFKKENLLETFIILLPFLAYFGGHSFLYWKGTGGSGGATRVMASIAPLAALLALKGMGLIIELAQRKSKLIAYALSLIIVYFIVITPKKIYSIPVKDFKDLALLRQAADWYKHSEYFGSYLIYGDERISTLLDMDPWDKEAGRWYLHDGVNPEKYIPDGAVYIWDAHFSTNFAHVQKEVVMKSKYYKLLKVFEPKHPFNVRGGYSYAIYIFRKHSGTEVFDNYKILENLRSEAKEDFKRLGIIDFEDGTTDSNKLSMYSYSGKYGYQMTPNDLFSPAIVLTGKDIHSHSANSGGFKMQVKMLADSASKIDDVHLVSSFFNKKGKNYAYYSSDSIILDSIPGWISLELKYKVPGMESKRDQVKVYVWNRGRKRFVLDDLELLFQ